MLSLNHLGLVERGAGKNAAALREMLSLFADLRDSATERKIRGIRSVDSRPVVRRVRERTGSGAARGIEVTVTLDEKAFEGSGAFLLGAILDRFFCRIFGAQSFHADRYPHDRARRDHALAGAHGRAEAAVSCIDDLQRGAVALRFLLACCGSSNAATPDRPRIGDSAARREEYVISARIPYMDFPASNLSTAERDDHGRLQVLRQIPRAARPAGRAAAGDDRGEPQLAA